MMIRNVCLALLICGHASAVCAGDARVKVFVGGKQVEADVLESGGKLYISLDALADVLGVDVTVKTNEVPASPAAVRPAEAAPAVSVTIKPRTPTVIKGKLTYQKNMYQRNVPDPGARAWLVKETELSGLIAAAGGTSAEPIPQKAVGWNAKLSGQYRFPVAVADEEGDFSFENIAPGAYVVIAQSRRANGLAARDREGKMRFKEVRVGEGQAADASVNFGLTAYRVEE